MSDLVHYGIKGMKWGVRKAKNNVSREAKRFGNYLIGNGKTATADRERYKRMRDDDKTFKTFGQRNAAKYGSKHPAIRLGESFAAGFAGMSVLQFTSGQNVTAKQFITNSATAGAAFSIGNEATAQFQRWRYERKMKKQGRT